MIIKLFRLIGHRRKEVKFNANFSPIFIEKNCRLNYHSIHFPQPLLRRPGDQAAAAAAAAAASGIPPPPPGMLGGPPGGGPPGGPQQQQHLNMLSKLHACEIHMNKQKRKNLNFLQQWLNKFPSRAKKIDVISRVIFPAIFAIFNLAYWCYYLLQEAQSEYFPRRSVVFFKSTFIIGMSIPPLSSAK